MLQNDAEAIQRLLFAARIQAVKGFFAHAVRIEKQGLRTVDRDQGRFRSYLLGALNHFLSDQRDRAKAQKRGGTHKILSIDFADGENHYSGEPMDQLSPDRLFERAWALTILRRAMERLEAESTSMHRPQAFRLLVAYLAPSGAAPPYCDVAKQLSMTEGAVKAAVYRLRKRYKQLLHAEIGKTVAEEEQVEEELRDPLTSLSL